jgi:hypothetical protein
VELPPQLRWKDLYREAELYKAAVRVYSKPLFAWRKALFTSTDGGTLYDMAARGLTSLDRLHRELKREMFAFRPAVSLQYNFNAKHRTLYIAPWEERIVDLLLYRSLTQKLRHWYSSNSYAYRDREFGLDRCQRRIAHSVSRRVAPLYILKRDIKSYFDSVNHDVLLAQLRELIPEDDYLYRLLEQRVRFPFRDNHGLREATVGIPFGTAVACALANIYLTQMDRDIEAIDGVQYFRYGDDLLVLAQDETAAGEARNRLRTQFDALRLETKPSHELDAVLGGATKSDYTSVRQIRHLGLQFTDGGMVGLSREKSRKIQNLFRFAFRRGRKRWRRQAEPAQRARILIEMAQETIRRGVRNVAILDYYLKHVNDEQRLRSLDRWLAEEILSCVFGGHKKGHFRRIGFAELRAMGLPSLVHRRHLILRGEIESPFFIWQVARAERAFRGTVARL